MKLKTIISTKIANEKARVLLDDALGVVTSSVKATFQTYVDNIKGTDAWTEEAQKTALQRAAETAKTQMSAEVVTYITEHFGDLDKWLVNSIEAEIYTLKNPAANTAAE